jgi:integrase/recombinase XerD
MTEQMTPLRRRMIDDMAIRNMSPNTQKIYIRAVANFSAYHGQSPDKLTYEDVREYQLHLASCGLKVRSTNVIMCALRFLYGTTLGKLNVSEHIPLARTEDTLPAVLAREEVERLLKVVSDPRMRTIFVTIYAAGLRVSEAVALTIHDIDSARMVIHVRQGKGRKDRFVMLSEQLLVILRDYWRQTRPPQLALSRP